MPEPAVRLSSRGAVARGMRGSADSRAVGSIRLTTALVARGPAAAVVLDDDRVAGVGEGAKRFPVRATINGFSWPTTVTRMGGESLLGLSRAVRDGASVEVGDSVEVELELDTAAREVDVPVALAEALARDPAARAAYESRVLASQGVRPPDR